MSDQRSEVIAVEGGELSTNLQAVLVVGSSHDVDGHVLDDAHVLGTVAGSEADEVVVVDDIEHPVQAVLNAPMGAHGAGEGAGVEGGKARLIGVAPIRKEP
jgi:hypothetical protein